MANRNANLFQNLSRLFKSGPIVRRKIKNLDTRTMAIEQILPTLATKEDLTTGLNGLETRLTVRIDDASRQARVRYEDLKGDIRMLADHIASASQKHDDPPQRG